MTGQEPAIIDRISDASRKATNAIGDWWHRVSAENRPPANPADLVPVKSLPIYNDPKPEKRYKFVVEEPLPLQNGISHLRHAFETEYERLASRFRTVDKTVSKSKVALTKTKNYLEDEWTVLPKAAAITIGGMAGFVLGLKR
ncbi:unnamed protein product [Cylicostephanus goldi]|uniref:MICOS complex subunit n=1 Tax=Cylicostephanus goldi TaxID=71465 RepID=A0A3P7MLM9_CYLGO|nr:unnamed protein product [Cylicostephanus goldi]